MLSRAASLIAWPSTCATPPVVKRLFHPIPVHLHDTLVHCLRLLGSSLKGVSAAFPARSVSRTVAGWQGGGQGLAMSLQLGPLQPPSPGYWGCNSPSTLNRSPFPLASSISPGLLCSTGMSFHATRQRGPTASCPYFSNQPALPGPVASPSLQTRCPQAPHGPVHPKSTPLSHCSAQPSTDSTVRVTCVTQG